MINYNKLMDVFKKIPAKGSILAIILIFVVIWFILPHISLSGTKPFSSVSARVLLLALVALAWLGKLAFKHLQTHKEKAFPLFMEKLKAFSHVIKIGSLQVWDLAKVNVSHLKSRVKQDKNKRRLRKLPWYLVLGTPQSGKKSLLANLGLYFAKAKHFGEDAENYMSTFPDFDWWFSEQAVLVDAQSHIKDSDTGSWKRFVKLLKRERKNKPLNGIILTFSLADILLYSNQKRQEFIQDTCMYIRNIHETFKSQVPVYIVFTKSDQVEGFMEFFNDLSKEELHQVWGMTLPVAQCDDMNKVLSFVNIEYGALVNKLRNQVLWALDTERNLRGRELIHSFPQQIQLFKKPVENFVTEMFSAVRYPKALQLRGIYFTSSKQEGEPNDFLLQAMSKKFQLVPPVVQRPQRMGECYFLKRLFFDVIYPEANVLGDSERSKKIRKWTYHSVRVAAPALVLLTILGMHAGYKENIKALKQVNTRVETFEQLQLQQNANNRSLLAMLPMLDQIQQAETIYHQHLPFGMKLMYETGSIHRQILDARSRILSNLFMPRVAASIEYNLNENIQDQNLLYATLKGYLAFSANDFTSTDAVKAPMEYAWNLKLKNKPDKIQQLRAYLQLAIKQPVTKLPLDAELISRIRGQLEQIVPSKRAYGLLQLKASVGDLPPLC